jgi:hypothetical protein
MKPKIDSRIKQAIREEFAWPGGYPLFILLSDGEVLCPSCAKQEYRQLVQATKDQDTSGWRPVAADINWEDEEMACCHCNEFIEPAYTKD